MNLYTVTALQHIKNLHIGRWGGGLPLLDRRGEAVLGEGAAEPEEAHEDGKTTADGGPANAESVAAKLRVVRTLRRLLAQ